MATEKTLKTRVKMKHGKESEWALATKFTPLIGEIIVYDVDNNHTSPRFKVGDGLTNVNNLKFVNQDELAKITTLGDELLAVQNDYVPHTRTINSKPLSANISLTASDVGAAASSHTHSYLPLSGGTVTGTLTVNKELYSNAAVISKRNGCPQLILQNANGAQLGTFYSTSLDGSYGNVAIAVNSSNSDVVYFDFAKNGQFTAPNNIYSKGTFVSQTNSYPGLTIQNASGANLAMLYSNGTNGGYSNTVLRVYSSASEYSSFSFGKDGVLEFGGVLRSGNHTIKGNSYPALSFTDLSVTKTFAYLQPQTSAGDYADVLLAVKNSSGQSNFLFAMNGDLTIGKKLYNPGGQVVKRLGLTSSGTNGYVKFATIDLTGTTHQNQPIRIAIAQRGRYGSFKLRFASVNSADPAVEQFVKTGQIEVYIHKKATSTWDLYLKKSEAYDDIDVTVYENGSHNSFKFTWVDTLVSALPSGYVTASEETWSGPAASANALNNTLSADKGGTGCSSLRAAGSAIINALDTGTVQPLDGDYYICQSAGGGTTDTEYVRRPMSALWSYIKSKGNSTYLPLTGGTLTGPLNLSGSVVITLNSKSDERQFMIRNSTNTENIYLYQTASTRGIYSTCSTGSVAVLQALAGSNSWTFNGVATSANTLNNTLSIEKGGTGATTAADARTNLEITPANIGAAASSHTHSYLPLSGGTISGSIAVTGNVTSNGKSVYTAGGNVIYSSTQPTGSTGMIWLKPV